MTDVATHQNTIRIRASFSKTLKGGWSDDSTVEISVKLDDDWGSILEDAIVQLREITERECDTRNKRDNFTGGF